jgi:hypothetical protein
MWWKSIIAGLLIAVAMLAATPIPSKVLTVKVTTHYSITGSIVVGAAAPSDSQLFSDEQEVLASINTANYASILCELGMHTILTRHK